MKIKQVIRLATVGAEADSVLAQMNEEGYHCVQMVLVNSFRGDEFMMALLFSKIG